MTRREIKLQKFKLAEECRRWERKQVRLERQCSQVSGFILSFGEVLDTLIPGGIGRMICRAVVLRRLRRREGAEA